MCIFTLKFIIINHKIDIQVFQESFQDRPIFTKTEVEKFYRQKDKNLSLNTINWRIHQLIKADVIHRVGQGKYQIGKTKNFSPSLKNNENDLHTVLKKHYPFIDYCIWNTELIKLFSLHQSYVVFHIIEVEKDALEAVFYFLKEKYKSVYLKPSQKMVEDYLLEMENVLVVLPLITEAPTQVVETVPTVTIEKMLVDLLSNKQLFYFYQGYELVRIFQQAFDKFTINKSKMLRYASRRRKKKEIKEILKTIKRH